MKRQFRIWANGLLVAGALSLSISSAPAFARLPPGPTHPGKTIIAGERNEAGLVEVDCCGSSCHFYEVVDRGRGMVKHFLALVEEVIGNGEEDSL